MVKISVVVPVYNVEKYVAECIESLMKQTLKDIEIILVNDNSKDNSNEICKQYLEKDSRISLYQSEGKGVSAARNIGIEHSNGEWISFVDSDDWLEEDMLEKLYNISTQRKSDIIMCDTFVNIGDEQKENDFYPEEKIFTGKDKDLLKVQAVKPSEGDYHPQFMACGVPWAKIYNKEFILKNKLAYKTNLPRRQDMIFNLEAFEKANEINYNKIKLYHYRKNMASKVHRFEANVCYEYNNIIGELKNYMESYSETKILEKSYNSIVVEYYRAFIKYFYSKENPKTTDEKLDVFNENLNKDEYLKILKNCSNRKVKIIVNLLRKRRKFLLGVFGKFKQ